MSGLFGDCGNGLEQSLGIGMAGRREHGFGRTAFNHLPGVKNQHTIGKAGEQRRVVRDEDHRETQLFSERSKHS